MIYGQMSAKTSPCLLHQEGLSPEKEYIIQAEEFVLEVFEK
jgi:hypothetical protein